MAIVTSFDVQYYNAYGNLIGTYNIKFYDTNYGDEESPEYYSSSPGLNGYTDAYVEDRYGEYIGMEVLDDGSFMTNTDWVSTLVSATGPLKVYSSSYTGGGGSTPPSGDGLQGTTVVTLVDENYQEIWTETVDIYAAGDEYTPYLTATLTIPDQLFNQYGDWSQINGCYYDGFNGKTLYFYSWDDTLFTEDIMIQGYYQGGGGSPDEPIYVNIYYEDPTGTYSSETDQTLYDPMNGYASFEVKDWTGRTNYNGEGFLYWVDDNSSIYNPGEWAWVGYNDLTLYAVWDSSSSGETDYMPIYLWDGFSGSPWYTDGINYNASEGPPSYTLPLSTPTREGYIFLYWDYPSNGESWHPGDTVTLYGNGEFYAVWQEGEPETPRQESQYFVKVNGSWKPGKLYTRQGHWI